VKPTRRRLLLRTAVAGAGLLATPVVRADGEIPGLLFQGGLVVPPAPVVVDPKLPRGPDLRWTPRPITTLSSARPTANARLCATLYPVCVHGGTEAERTAALAHLQRAFVQWSYVLNRPAPLGDLALGGGPELDVYLTKQEPPLLVERDAPRLATDQSSGFCVLDSNLVNAQWLTLCVAEVASLNADAAIGDGIRRGLARYATQPLLAYDPTSLVAIDRAQANPQAPLLTRETSELSDAAALFWAYVDANFGAGAYGDLPFAMLTLSRRQEVATKPHPQWDNTPDELDVLRRAFTNDAQRIADTFVNFAVWRAFLGDRSDAAHRPFLTELGELGRIRFDWVFPYSTLPRHVAGPYPVYPLGAAYVWVDLDRVPKDAELGFRAEWEQPVQFQWALVRVDAEGRALSQLTLPYVERATSVEKTLLNVSGAAGLLIVGINLGAVDSSHPFDPDQEPWEPHGYSVYLTELAH
jgi:hypothetical protein